MRLHSQTNQMRHVAFQTHILDISFKYEDRFSVAHNSQPKLHYYVSKPTFNNNNSNFTISSSSTFRINDITLKEPELTGTNILTAGKDVCVYSNSEIVWEEIKYPYAGFAINNQNLVNQNLQYNNNGIDDYNSVCIVLPQDLDDDDTITFKGLSLYPPTDGGNYDLYLSVNDNTTTQDTFSDWLIVTDIDLVSQGGGQTFISNLPDGDLDIQNHFALTTLILSSPSSASFTKSISDDGLGTSSE